MKKLIIALLFASQLFAVSFTLTSGWNLLGAPRDIPTSELLNNSNIQNIVIFENGSYKSSSANEFSTIKANSGFWVYTKSAGTLSVGVADTAVGVKKLDADLNVLPDNASQWAIMHIVDAGLYVQMKNDFTVNQQYTWEEAIDYCTSLTVGSTDGWRLPTQGELAGIGGLYDQHSSFFGTVNGGRYWASSSACGYSNDACAGYITSSSVSSPSKSTSLRVACVKDAL
jgi:hypothetical protein